MDEYAGKHLLVDCYGCREDSVNSSEAVMDALHKAADQIEVELQDTFFVETEEEIICTGVGDRCHICIHAYPKMNYAAADVYSFAAELKPAGAMRVFRKLFKPGRIRATSVKRGNMNAHPDMKPNTKSKSTTLHKFRNTGHHINQATKKMANYMRHKNEKRDTLGPE